MTFFDVLVWIAYICTLYVLVYWVLLYLEGGRTHVRAIPKKEPKTWPAITVLVPAYNEERSLSKTLDSLLGLDYPKKQLHIIVINDGSTDKTELIAKHYQKTHKTIQYIYQKNAGKASALNRGLQDVKTPYFACLDADSFVQPQAAKEMVKSFTADKKLQIAVPVMQVANPTTWIQKFQRLEYLSAMLLVRMMSYIDSNYVAPGPFSMYRTLVIKKLGGFDENNLVEDQEIAYRVQEHHGKIRQVETAVVETIAPDTFKKLRKQRNRWMKGTVLNLFNYRHLLFNPKYGDFGSFMMPITGITFLLAIIALTSVVILTIWPFIRKIYDFWLVGFDLIPYLNDLQFTFNPLNVDYTSTVLVWIMLAVSIFFLYASSKMYKDDISRYGKIYILPYFFIYFLLLSIVAVQVIIELLIGKKQKW